ncbi:NUDIX hydrolase [Desulfatirhabdium butyrativorans]|uniref:NUDIX hydrolase n=1 Tax=Desulfatirhabdium butyrativorans TaxID=340467 RepID=UPI00040D967C|nr:CoA pyrophosphatase [Desulfatirhabdium butyrativorans]
MSGPLADPTLFRGLVAETVHPGAPKSGCYRLACVFLLLFERKGCLNLLAIQKTDTEGYPWRNQVALPGGHIDPEDPDALSACFRELHEELGIESHEVIFTGSMGHFQTINDRDLEVFSGFWKGDRAVSHRKKEISRVLNLPVQELMKTHIEKGYHGWIPDVHTLLYPVEDVTVWGVTARIVHHFLEMIHPLRNCLGP